MSARRAAAGSRLYAASLVAVYGFLLAPIVVVLLASVNSGEYLKFPPDGFSLKWYRRFLDSRPFLDSLLLSLRLAVVSALAVTAIGSAAAIYYVRFATRAREALRLVLIAPLLLPEILTAIALLFFYHGIGLGTKTLVGLQLGHVLVTLPFAFLCVASALYNFDRSLEEAARGLGAGRWTVFRRVTLPLIKPGVINGALFAFIVSFDTFSISLLLKSVGSTTLPIQLYEYISWDFDPTAAAVSTASIAITLGAVWLTDRLVGLRVVRF
jgi:putative spermidine/putrescine transport system permease protein